MTRKEQVQDKHIRRLETVLNDLWKVYSGDTDLKYHVPGWEEMGNRFRPLIARHQFVGAIVCRAAKEEDLYQ